LFGRLFMERVAFVHSADGSFGIWTDAVEAIRRQGHSHGQAGISADGNKSQRTLLSPAESVNSLTIGAAHAGSGFTGNLPDGRYDPFTDEDLPSIISAMGLGFRKVVKPELLFAGGRAPVRIGVSGERIEIAPVLAGVHLFGLKAARPSLVGGDRYEDFTFGTSVWQLRLRRGARIAFTTFFSTARADRTTPTLSPRSCRSS
jgi:hypothetical protein